MSSFENCKNIILASKSPRRFEIMKMAGFDFEVVAKDTDESGVVFTSPDDYVKQLSRRKLDAVYKDYTDCIVVAADTIVWCNGEIYGKPKDRDDAFRMLKSMSDNVHQVYTGVSVYKNGAIVTDSVCTDVYFRKITDDEINYYLDNYKVTDKAGAYGIQEYASLFVEKIVGDYYNIVGLPICRCAEMIRN